MKVEWIRIFNGVNFYTHEAAVVASLDYENVPKKTTREFPELRNRLFEVFPSLTGHCCDKKSGLAFSERITEGVHLTHAIEHIALELFDQIVGNPENVPHCGSPRTKHDRLVVETTSGKVMRYLIPRAVGILDAVVRGEVPVLENTLVLAREILTDAELEPSGRCIIDAAQKLGIPWTREDDHSLIQLGYGRNLHFVRAESTDLSSDIAADIVGDKSETKKPVPQARGGIIEINAAPGLRMHVHPSEGMSRDVGRSIIETLYPDNAPSRIPIIAVTGTNGKTTVTRMISHVLRTTGQTIGTTTTDGIMLNGESIVFGDTTGPASARTILSNKMVDIAVLETARGGILRRGLGWDWADFAVVTNITEDHIGQDGITSVKDLVEIKALIAERVREGGTLVLNADDEESADLVNRPAVSSPQRNVVFFSTREANPIIRRHIDAGGTAYFLEDGWISEARRGSVEKLVETARIPVTINGSAEYQIQNAMAATAVARGMRVSATMIRDALNTFSGDRDNQGRTNIYRVNEGFVVVDYGHNPKAIEAIGKMISNWGMRSTGIISFPGDRTDTVIEAATKQAAKAFDRIIIKGDKNLRGRQEGEVAEMMIRVIEANDGPKDTTFEPDPYAAFDQAVSVIGANEAIVFFYEKLEPTRRILEKYHAVPTENVFSTVTASSTSGGVA